MKYINKKKLAFYLMASFVFLLSANPIGWFMSLISWLGVYKTLLDGYTKEMNNT